MKYVFTFLFVVLAGKIFTQDKFNVLLLDEWNDTTITLAVEDARYSDLWSFKANGDDYVAVGSSEGVEILAINDKKLSRVARAAGAFQGFTVVHRDFKTYQNYLYAVCDEGASSLQIFDTQYLPDSLHKVFDSNTFFTICHNIFVDEQNAKLYCCGPNNTGMKILDISNPELPVLELDFNNVTYVHDCYVSNDTAFLNCGTQGVHVYDFSGTFPVQIGLLDFYANQGYNHSGWMSPDKTKYSFIDETVGTKVKLCELNDYSLLQIDELYAPQEYEDYTPHNVILLNKTAFVAYYNLGLRIYDISSAPIKEIAAFDTFEPETAYTQNGAWGISIIEEENLVLICDRQNGIFLFEFPIDILENGIEEGSLVSHPFIDENSRIIARDYFDEAGISFSVYTTSGQRIFNQESIHNWMNIPLTLSAGTYLYGIYDSEKELLESGKFVKGN
ncbi:MAG: choice-of-anchor B family protein [Crocinitomicaceae bacterium]